MDSLVQYLISPIKRLIAIMMSDSPAPFITQTDEQASHGDTVNDQVLAPPCTIEDRIRWIDEMIRLAPNLHDRQRSTYAGAYLRYFYFHYLEEKQLVIFRVSSCNCGACDSDLNEHRIHGRFSEQNWNAFWPIVVGRLQYLNAYSNEKPFHGCICIESQPNEPSTLIEGDIHPFVVMWDIKPSSASVLNCASRSNPETQESSSPYNRAPDSSALH